MTTDLAFEDNVVVARCHRLSVDGEDLELRSSTRLGSSEARAGRRRALVHGTKDQLILNYSGDYQETEVHGTLRVRQGRRSVPMVVVMNGRGGDGVSLVGQTGTVSCREVRLEGLPYGGANGTDSLLATIEWLHARVQALEDQLNVQTPPFPSKGRRG